MDYHDILVTEADGVGTLTMNRPDRMNALTSRMRAEMLAAVQALAARNRVLVLTGAGRGFCAGQDLADRADGAFDVEQSLNEEYAPLVRALSGAPVPVIAAVNGAAAGAGANLALACDVVIAAESAVFLQAFARIGLIPDAGGTWVLPRRVGTARAMGLSLFAEPLTARQAADWGLIWEAVPDADFPTRIAARAAQIAAGPGRAYAGIREALRASGTNTLDQQLALEARLQKGCAESEDFAEGVRAFLDKRKPAFRGH